MFECNARTIISEIIRYVYCINLLYFYIYIKRVKDYIFHDNQLFSIGKFKLGRREKIQKVLYFIKNPYNLLNKY